MSAHVEPALTPDQWRWWLGPTVNLSLSIDGACDRVGYDLHLSRPALMALANANLPDGEPRKLTWAMVYAIRRAAAVAGESFRSLSPYGLSDEERTALLGAAAAIASLLPPPPKVRETHFMQGGGFYTRVVDNPDALPPHP